MEKRRKYLSLKLVFKRVLKCKSIVHVGKVLFAILHSELLTPTKYDLTEIEPQPQQQTLALIYVILRELNTLR